jgi:flagellar FliJ protein
MSTAALTTLLQRAEAERDTLAMALQRLEDQLRRQQLQADQLGGYRGEYQQRWANNFARGGAPEIVHCYQSFMGRIDDAITQQQAQAQHTAAHRDRLRADLVAAEMRVASVRKLVERRLAEQRQADQRREQRHADELAQRRRLGDTRPAPLSPH